MATITKRVWRNKGGKHQAWVVSYTDSEGNRHREQFGTKRLAEARRIDVEGQIKNGLYRASAQTTTVEDACRGYLTVLTKQIERRERVPAYLDHEASCIWNYICPKPGRKTHFSGGISGIKLADLTARSVGSFRDRMRAGGRSVKGARRVIGTLTRVLGYAVSEDLVAVNVSRSVRVTGKRGEGSEKISPPSKEEFAALLSACRNGFKVAVIFSAATAVRISELFALTWSKLDLDNAEVHIDSRVDRKMNRDTTKSKAGLRTIPLARALVSTLRDWRCETQFGEDFDLVFPNSLGKFQSQTNFRRRLFLPAQEEAKKAMAAEGKLYRRFGWHYVRHFAISLWIESGLSEKTVQTFAGHATLAMTMDLYGHLFPSKAHHKTMDTISAGLYPGYADLNPDSA
ncbi:site-specific integrase [Rhizobium sp. NZLR10]|uniref:tyrosine-type recombinase/integrase n=1 Tax=Rhizobium sp. NZLR10 TaxID=2731097 RepID=UPI001C8393C5|nr:site-specific integrase [Rhizobium sp. NZLR10]MBX5195745.1 site-specific integrase [Rhizobium sp. NZLR10]